ncbi:Eco57I restriction-modification methylase domain-containing protein [uncultured Nostoc sp.]|uniref:Eco57I restriction-modification methylase domain-containing protein n=1 Tax=uncultured Nostoc sp. TaxID=340711 RepID=UPI0035C971BA
MSVLELQQSILNSLQNLKSLDALKKLFWSQLNYERVNKELSRRKLTDVVANELTEDPLLLASGGANNAFHVIYARLSSEELSRQSERKVVDYLLKEHPYALFVFSNKLRSQWHFINVKYDNTLQKRKLFRRITVGEGEQLRTATERISLLDLENIHPNASPLDIQTRHDEAFDVEAVTQEFFREYRKTFEKVEGLIEWNTNKERKRLFTQKLFNRLMFIGFIQKKGWLKFQGSIDYLSALWEAYLKDDTTSNKNFYKDRLSHLFFLGLNNPQEYDIASINNGGLLKDLIGHVPYLNGGLFEQDEDDINDEIIVSDDCIDSIIHDLFQRFAFTVTESTPLDVEVAVDPEMLGKVFEELVTGRHESGSYYTPKPIVSFMCREAIKGYLKTQVLGEATDSISEFVDEHLPDNIKNPEAILEALRRVKCCDLAAVSGAYILGMLHELLDLRQCLFANKGLDYNTVYQRKLDIIENNLYGVDIDIFAVNIARLRLWLSLAVEFEADNPPPLPNLKYKIEVGDSLIAPSPATTGVIRHEFISQYRQKKAEYMRTHEGGKKQKLEQEINELKTQIALITHGSTQVAGFDWSVEFAEVFTDGGFDIELVNPPYVRADAQFKHLAYNEQVRQAAISEWKIYREKLKRSQIYQTLYEKWDLYIPFLERAYQLLCNNGQMVFIIPDAYNAAKYTLKSHDFFLNKSCIQRIDFCSDIPLFNAGVSNTIIHFSNSTPEIQHQPVRTRRWGEKPDNFEHNIEILSTDLQTTVGLRIFRVESSQQNNLKTKYDLVELENICYVSVGMVINADEDGHQGTFKTQDVISEIKTITNPERFVLGKDVDKWCLRKIRYLEWGTKRAPHQFRRPTFSELQETKEKLIAVRTPGALPKVTYDNESLHFDASSVGFVLWHNLKNVTNKSISKTSKYKWQSPDGKREEYEFISQQFHPKYLIAVMNSTFARDWLATQRRSTRHIYPDDWKRLPIVTIPMQDQIEFVSFVDAILAELQQHSYPLPLNIAKKIMEWEKEIDERVAALYGL